MNLTDPVADFLTRIRNSIRARHQKLDVPASKLKAEIARILKEEGYIANYKPTEENGQKVLRVYLKYGPNNEAVIRDLQRVSRPGCRVYLGRDEIRRVQGGLGGFYPDAERALLISLRCTNDSSDSIRMNDAKQHRLQWNEISPDLRATAQSSSLLPRLASNKRNHHVTYW